MNLGTSYLGKNLNSPLVVSASPLSQDVSNIRKMEDCGAGAVVLYSLFEEQIKLEQKELFYHTTHGTESYAEALSYFPEPDEYRVGPEEYLEHIHKAKEAVRIPVIASINGSTPGGWTGYARNMEEAGADAIELNIYGIQTDGYKDSAAIENEYAEILASVKEAVHIPVALKLSPYFTNMALAASRFEEAGADALVLFNRFYQPDIDLEELEVRPNVVLSTSNSIKLAMRWIAILRDRTKCSLAATSGVHSAMDVIKLIMVGADVTMMCSSLIKYGIEHLKNVKKDMEAWMTAREYESVRQMKGSMSRGKVAEPSAFERAQYMKAITNYVI